MVFSGGVTGYEHSSPWQYVVWCEVLVNKMGFPLGRALHPSLHSCLLSFSLFPLLAALALALLSVTFMF